MPCLLRLLSRRKRASAVAKNLLNSTPISGESSPRKIVHNGANLSTGIQHLTILESCTLCECKRFQGPRYSIQESPKLREKLEVGEYEAEFFVNTKANPFIHHYIITIKGSPEIQAWGQAFSQQDCLNEAKEFLEQLRVGRAFKSKAI
jgi:hypothetical protein